MEHNDRSDPPPAMLSFALRHGEHIKAGLRLGQLVVQGRPPVSTPSLVVPTSRGVVPHVTQDAFSKLTQLSAVYIALEDFIERSPSKAPVLHQESSQSRLRDFVALPEKCLSILGPRRIPAIETPNQNGNTSIAICTSVGFQPLELDDYIDCANKLEADITVGLADIITAKQISQKRIEKSADRTHAWTRDTLAAKASSNKDIFATVPHLEMQQQSFYLADLADEYKADIGGISLYSPETAANLPESLHSLPRLCIDNPSSPHDILRAVSLGNDLITISFVTAASEAGIAMTFDFVPPAETQGIPLGIDQWDKSHATDLSPLARECQCYSCAKHHRAYIHHLLSAKEMLAWTLLQIHNFHVMEDFFEAIRQSITDGTFEQKARTFGRVYQPEMPKATGEGPRVRGYQMKSVGGGEPRKNQKKYGRLEEQARKLEEAESGIATPEDDILAHDLENMGMGAAQNKPK